MLLATASACGFDAPPDTYFGFANVVQLQGVAAHVVFENGDELELTVDPRAGVVDDVIGFAAVPQDRVTFQLRYNGRIGPAIACRVSKTMIERRARGVVAFEANLVPSCEPCWLEGGGDAGACAARDR